MLDVINPERTFNMNMIYLFITTLATLVGAISGFGGGVIIRPVLDAIGDYNSYVTGILSSTAVLCMAAISSITNLSSISKIDIKVYFLISGAIAGGMLGRFLFSLASFSFMPSAIEIIQASIIIILLVFILFKNKLPQFNIKSLFLSLIAGFILGSLSAFLGVGGGPFNVALLCLLFSMDIKNAASASVLIIFFSQTANLITAATTTGFGGYDYSMLLFMIPGGILGGFLGSKLKSHIPDKIVERLYFIITIGLITLNVYNMFCSMQVMHLWR
jgi:uncharacterized membrane protein YfcA